LPPVQSATTPLHSLLATDEAPPFSIDNAPGDRPVLIVCDHASNRVPNSLGSLGLADHYWDQHIAWDVGAAAVAGHLGRLLGVGVIYAGYSRLVLDVNRGRADAGAIPKLTDGILVPGNLALPSTDRQARIAGLFVPYHQAISHRLRALARADQTPVLISIHSFTPFLHGVFRPWDIGILWSKDPRLPVPLMAALRSRSDWMVGDNLPYSGMHVTNYTIDTHAGAAGFAHVGIEIRQDHIAAAKGQLSFGSLLAESLAEVLDQPALYQPRCQGQV
jgi:predicted N-formylglutamate amidohydrolase